MENQLEIFTQDNCIIWPDDRFHGYHQTKAKTEEQGKIFRNVEYIHIANIIREALNRVQVLLWNQIDTLIIAFSEGDNELQYRIGKAIKSDGDYYIKELASELSEHHNSLGSPELKDFFLEKVLEQISSGLELSYRSKVLKFKRLLNEFIQKTTQTDIPEEERVYKNEDIHYFRYGDVKQEANAKLISKATGKKSIGYCCDDTLEAFERCGKIGLDNHEWKIFHECLFDHPYTKLPLWHNSTGEGRKRRSYFDGEHTAPEIIMKSDLIERERIQDLLIEEISIDISISNNGDTYAQMIVKFLKDYYAEHKQRRDLSSTPSISLIKHQWKGTQGQLAELFIELKKKGWIEGFEYKTIQHCFTKSNSIDQYLKPAVDKKTYEPTFEKVYKPRYKPMFFAIKENPNTEVKS